MSSDPVFHTIFFVAERDWARRSINIYALQSMGDSYAVGQQPLIGDFIKPGAALESTAPTLKLDPEEAQNLMDELWRVGLRPTDAGGDAKKQAEGDATLQAIQAHLEDMRKIAFGLLMADLTGGDVDPSGAAL